MKTNILWVFSFFLLGCSTWKQKEFEKDLNSPSQEVKSPDLNQEELKILEKFQIKSASKVVEEKKKVLPPKVSPPLIEKKKFNKEEEQKKEKISDASSEISTKEQASLPLNYPEDLKALNSRASKVWALYRPNHFEAQKIYLDINYLGVTVGKIMLLNQGKKNINDKEVWHFHARFRSAPFYSNIYELDDTVDTYVTSEKFLSTRYSLIQRESKQDVDDLQLHDRDQLKTYSFYYQKKSDGSVKNKKKEGYIPFYSIDPFSVVFFYQGLPLNVGDHYEIPIINKGKILILKSLVEGRENVTTKKGPRKAIRVHATTKYTGETLKSGDLYFWFSDDNQKTLIKAQAKIKIGSVTAELVDK